MWRHAHRSRAGVRARSVIIVRVSDWSQGLSGLLSTKAVQQPVAVVISGAPGSGKTTLGRLLSERLQLPHLNKDTLMASLTRSGLSYEVANKRAFALLYGSAQRWLASGMSLVMDMTMYPEFSPAEVGSLQPHGLVVNVHCRAEDALARWEHKVSSQRPELAEAIIERGRPVQDIASEPLDFGCPRIDVDTTEGYAPSMEEIISSIERLQSASTAGRSNGTTLDWSIERLRGERDERPWGSYEVLEDAASHKVKRIEVHAGRRLSYQRHQRRAEHWFIVSGAAEVTLDGDTLRLFAGQAIDIPRGAAHRIANRGDDTLVFIEVQHGEYFGEDDIERLDDDFGRVG